MRIGHIEVFVRNPAESRAFYEEVLGFEVTNIQGDGNFVWLQLGETEILLRPSRNPHRVPTYQDAATALVLYTDDQEAALQALKSRGVEFLGDDGPDCPTFTDPDGNWFQLVSPP